MKKTITGAALGLAVLGLSGAGIATASGGSAGEPASRLDDGQQYLPQAKVSEQEAIAAAQTRASGELNEVDLEQAGGRLVWTVDVGNHDVKVDAASGDVASVDTDD